MDSRLHEFVIQGIAPVETGKVEVGKVRHAGTL